ncbi:MAG: helix-turn-helix domain-containing protein [Chromatiales bacterium]
MIPDSRSGEGTDRHRLELVGEPAMRNAVRWRMQAALDRLKEADVLLGELSRELGYDSKAAFSRAFKRIIGASAGAARRPGGIGRWDCNSQ